MTEPHPESQDKPTESQEGTEGIQTGEGVQKDLETPGDSEAIQTQPTGSEGHHDSHTPEATPFTEEQWAEFRQDDAWAGGAIVALMAAIFTVGFFLYGTIAYLVYSS